METTKTKTQYRMTKQRKEILEILRSTKSHPTADWVYEQVKKKIPKVSLGTVYRNLRILKEMGEILELNYGSTFSRFDGKPENHYHFVCKSCEKVMDVDTGVSHEMEKSVSKDMNCKVDFHRLEFYGTCHQCL